MNNPVKDSLGGPQLGFSRLHFGFGRFAIQDHDHLSRLNSASFMHKNLFHDPARRRPDRQRSDCSL
jgi:hypothetical protein